MSLFPQWLTVLLCNAEMKMPEQELNDTFSYLVKALKRDQPNLSYLHLTQPRVAGGFDAKAEKAGESLDFLVSMMQLHMAEL